LNTLHINEYGKNYQGEILENYQNKTQDSNKKKKPTDQNKRKLK
jgi:hypothetical protein